MLFHCFWTGGQLGEMQLVSLRSALRSQRSLTALKVWLDGDDAWHGRADVQKALADSRVSVHRFQADACFSGTPLASCPAAFAVEGPPLRSDLFRYSTLFKEGGIYFDLDMLFLRDIGALCSSEFATYHGSQEEEKGSRGEAGMINNAILCLQAGGGPAASLLASARDCLDVGQTIHASNGNMAALRMTTKHPDLRVLPCSAFEPFWLEDVPPFPLPQEIFFGPRTGEEPKWLERARKTAYGIHWHGCAWVASPDSWLFYIVESIMPQPLRSWSSARASCMLFVVLFLAFLLSLTIVFAVISSRRRVAAG